jgi:hypothetical protein
LLLQIFSRLLLLHFAQFRLLPRETVGAFFERFLNIRQNLLCPREASEIPTFLIFQTGTIGRRSGTGTLIFFIHIIVRIRYRVPVLIYLFYRSNYNNILSKETGSSDLCLYVFAFICKSSVKNR